MYWRVINLLVCKFCGLLILIINACVAHSRGFDCHQSHYPLYLAARVEHFVNTQCVIIEGEAQSDTLCCSASICVYRVPINNSSNRLTPPTHVRAMDMLPVLFCFRSQRYGRNYVDSGTIWVQVCQVRSIP